MKERLKNLYQNGEITAAGLLSAVANGWLTVADMVEMVGEDNATEVVHNAKIAEISATCNTVIVAGIDIQLGEETEHFNLSIEDQTAITSQTTYHNALKAYVQSLTDVEDISAVTYGMALPAEYAAEMNAKLGVAQAQMEAIVARLNGQEG